jgi:transposase
MQDTEIFTLGLGLKGTPWFVEKVELNPDTRRLDLHLNFRAGTKFIHPISGQLAPVHDTLHKTWRHMNFFHYECHLHARVPRVKDAQLGVRLIPVPWARPDSGFTLLMEAWIVTLVRTTMAVMEAARLVDEYCQRLWRILDHYVGDAHARADLGGVKTLGLDEVCVRRGRDYLTVASTPATATEPARVLDVAEGRDTRAGKAVIAFAQAHGAQISQAVLDMSPAYRKAVAESLPQAAVSFDWFHVMARAGEAVDAVRRREMVTSSALLKNTRYLWLTRSEHLSEARQEQQQKLLRSGLATVRAWTRLEALRDIAAQPAAEAERDLKWWCGWAMRSRIPEIQKLVGTIRAHWDGIVNYLRTRITNATAEALNGIIQTVKRKARGYRTTRCFKIMILLVAGHLDLRLPNVIPARR